MLNNFNCAVKTYSTNNRYLLSMTKEAIVDEIIRPNQLGRVRYRGSLWNAKCIQELTVNTGEVVYVLGNHGITLIVDTIPNNDNIAPDISDQKLPLPTPLLFAGKFLLLLFILL
ncbi:NfeD family protein [Okeania sp. SIO2C2]|uniref:NfeD family protein n=1 Tax=Okeania sp. SIO2C2 TaxID=2607787 RepID=UPI0025799452|nr:NfeD family protein [Okeania sp. SIO2C2]